MIETKPISRGVRWTFEDAIRCAEHLAKEDHSDEVRGAAFDAACYLRVLLAKFPRAEREVSAPF